MPVRRVLAFNHDLQHFFKGQPFSSDIDVHDAFEWRRPGPRFALKTKTQQTLAAARTITVNRGRSWSNNFN